MLAIVAFLFFHCKSPVAAASFQNNMVSIREAYAKASGSKTATENLERLISGQKLTPVINGYFASVHFFMASHDFAPWNKWSEFKTGKKMLERAIALAPQEPELRYIRLSLQANLPSFLNYSNNIKEDQHFLKAALPKIIDPDLKKRIEDWFKSKGQ